MHMIEARHGVSFELKKGQFLKVTDIKGEQVSDFFAFMKNNPSEYLSSGRTLDYLSKLYPTTGDLLYSSDSNVMAEIVSDSVGRHDFLLTPCSKDTFRIIYGDKNPHHGCQGNLIQAFEKFNIHLTSLPVTFNLFMNVVISESGDMKVSAPRSRANDSIVIMAHEDLIVGLTACSALQSNNGSFKPIGFEISDKTPSLSPENS